MRVRIGTAKGVETRRARFSPRMVHSGWGMDLVPEDYMRRMAHYGYDALLVYVKKVGKTKSCAAFAAPPRMESTSISTRR